MTNEKKEELLNRRSELKTNIINLNSFEFLHLMSIKGTPSPMSLSGEYKQLLLKYSKEEIDKIDKELGI